MKHREETPEERIAYCTVVAELAYTVGLVYLLVADVPVAVLMFFVAAVFFFGALYSGGEA